MICTIDVRCNAANPNLPIKQFVSFKNSPSSIRVLDVPKKIGKWNITSVYVQVKYPDSSTRSTFFSNINASTPELKIYVSKISSVDDSYVEDVKPEDSSIEEDINIFNNYKIDTPTKNETT